MDCKNNTFAPIILGVDCPVVSTPTVSTRGQPADTGAPVYATDYVYKARCGLCEIGCRRMLKTHRPT